jgi:hypothetical protein
MCSYLHRPKLQNEKPLAASPDPFVLEECRPTTGGFHRQRQRKQQRRQHDNHGARYDDVERATKGKMRLP